MTYNCYSPLQYEPTDSGTIMQPITIGSLVVKMMSGYEAKHLAGFEHDCVCRPEGDVFVVFDDRDMSPVAYCCVTKDHEMRAGARFETAEYFNCESMIARYPDKRFMEVGVFHVLDEAKGHRAKAALWQAIADYCDTHDIDYLIGSFTFSGKYPASFALELSFLYHYYQAEPQLRVAAKNGVSMDIMPQEAIKPSEAFGYLPPMLRYCLRMGAKVGEGVVCDQNHDGVSIFLMMPAQALERISA